MAEEVYEESGGSHIGFLAIRHEPFHPPLDLLQGPRWNSGGSEGGGGGGGVR